MDTIYLNHPIIPHQCFNGNPEGLLLLLLPNELRSVF